MSKNPNKTPDVQEEAKAAPTAPVAPQTEADKIWLAIKDLSIQMFALPDQTVEMHCAPVTVEPSKLYVVIRSSATLPSLEAAVAPRFQVEQADKFIIITPVPQVQAAPKKKW